MYQPILNKFFDVFQMQAESSGKEPTQSVQTFGRKKTATAVAYCKRGQGIIRVNGKPLEQVEPKPLQFKLQEPLLLLGKDRFSEVDIRIRVKGGGRIAQIYAIRQALSKALASWACDQKEQTKCTLKSFTVRYHKVPITVLIFLPLEVNHTTDTEYVPRLLYLSTFIIKRHNSLVLKVKK